MAELHYSAGLALYNLHKFREATEELNQVVTLNPKHAPGHFGLALTFLAIGDRKGAQKQQDVLESLDPVYAAKLAKLLAIETILACGDETEFGCAGRTPADPIALHTSRVARGVP